mmetsp:Transcript_37962/g.55976  ORF Transcript_37962/g.55976 Transcript_37962/m.55976 type:complete len:80 (-) Transcript_37962:65-304(-)
MGRSTVLEIIEVGQMIIKRSKDWWTIMDDMMMGFKMWKVPLWNELYHYREFERMERLSRKSGVFFISLRNAFKNDVLAR